MVKLCKVAILVSLFVLLSTAPFASQQYPAVTVWSVAISPDGRYALSGSGYNNDILMWDLASGKTIRTFSGHHDVPRSVVFSPDGRYVLSGSWDNTLKLWDVASGREIKTLRGHAGAVYSVAFFPDGKHAFSGGYNGKVDQGLKLWDLE